MLPAYEELYRDCSRDPESWWAEAVHAVAGRGDRRCCVTTMRARTAHGSRMRN